MKRLIQGIVVTALALAPIRRLDAQRVDAMRQGLSATPPSGPAAATVDRSAFREHHVVRATVIGAVVGIVVFAAITQPRSLDGPTTGVLLSGALLGGLIGLIAGG